jgi:peptidoglycan/LPS O-acetylase OafA/YrhL/CubicO group peptidase (beta-lactamase class C family)
MSTPGPTATSSPGEIKLPFLPGLDGLRAFAVIAVLLYHADLPLRGGFLGVEVFFTLSGFLITALLVGEQAATGRIDLRDFWMRRARRLLPALALVLLSVFAIAAMLPTGETAGLGGDLLAAIGYVMNWRLVLSGQSYFDAGVRPSLLQHLWSLAVEEQFYLIWPLLFVAGLRLLRPTGLLLTTLLLAAGSAFLSATLYDPGADPSRIYYGTDTRASGILLGAALAMLWAPWRQPALSSRRLGRALDVGGLLALGGLVFAVVQLFDSHPLLYRGGLIAVAVLTLVVIAGLTHPQARLLPALLGSAPLRWVGVRSYGIYLWHWPVFQVTRPFMDVPFGNPAALVLRLALALLLAELSYRWVEAPVRAGAIGRLWRAIGARWQPHGASSPAALAPSLAIGGGPALRMLPFAAGGSSPRPAPAAPAASRRSPAGPWRGWPALSLLLVAATSAACGSFTGTPEAPQAAVAPSPLPVAVATEADTPTAASTPTVAASPTRAPSATATATASPTATPITAAEATATAEAALPPVDVELASALQAILDRTVADGSIPGAVVAVNVPGRQTWVGASGLADLQEQTPMTPETEVRIASISKVFTAATVMLLVEEGQLSLDDTLATWYPDLVPAAETITVRSLLQHRTGLYDFLEDRAYVTQAYQQPDRIFAPDELVAYAAQFPPAFEPAAEDAWDYSSTNYVILGMVVEAVTGNTLAQEMRARIFEPLGLEHTYFTPDETIAGPFATGNTRGTVQRNVAMSFGYGTANLVSTAEDVQRFGRALFAGDLLSEESREQMLGFVNGKGQYSMPELAYGLGVMRNVLPTSHSAALSTVYGHIGGFGGFRSALWYGPESGVTVALGMNQGATDPNLLATELFEAALSSLDG